MSPTKIDGGEVTRRVMPAQRTPEQWLDVLRYRAACVTDAVEDFARDLERAEQAGVRVAVVSTPRLRWTPDRRGLARVHVRALPANTSTCNGS